MAEIIVCEDGRDQATGIIIETAARLDSRIKHFHLPFGARGPGSSRNLGITSTNCEWVAFLDDDDRWFSDKIRLQVNFTVDSDVVCANALRSSGGMYFRGTQARTLSRRGLLLSNLVITSTCMVRRAALEAIGGFSTDFALLGVEDYECWLRLVDSGACFTYLDRPVIEYADQGDDRLSARTAALADLVARIAWRRAIRERTDAICWAAAGRHTVTMGATRVRRAARQSSELASRRNPHIHWRSPPT